MLWIIDYSWEGLSKDIWWKLEAYAYAARLNLIKLINWGRVASVWVNKIGIIALDNGLVPVRHQAIILINAGVLFIGPFVTNCSELSIKKTINCIQQKHFEKCHVQNRRHFIRAQYNKPNLPPPTSDQ